MPDIADGFRLLYSIKSILKQRVPYRKSLKWREVCVRVEEIKQTKMTPEEVLFSLYNRRKELEAEAIRNYQLGVGPAYTTDMENIDDQINKIIKSGVRLPTITNALVRPSNPHQERFDEKHLVVGPLSKNVEVSSNKPLIKKLTIVEPEAGNRYQIIVNENYRMKPLSVDRKKKCWGLLLRVMKGDFIEADEHKNSIEYFNVNLRCLLYTRSGCALTKILGIEGGTIALNINKEIISPKALATRQNTQKGNLK
jgi:hypothetical protein